MTKSNAGPRQPFYWQLVVAGVTAVSLASLNGCGDDTSLHAHDAKANAADSQNKMPVDVETQSKSTQSKSTQAGAQAPPPWTDQLKSLRQNIHQQHQHAQDQRHALAQRIDKLDKRVQSLHKYVAQLKKAKKSAIARNTTAAKKPGASDQRPGDADPLAARVSQVVSVPALVKAASTGDGESPHHDANNASDQAHAGGDAPHDALAPAHCADQDNARTGFDVVYQADAAQKLRSAQKTATKAGISDLFRSASRLYLGRYDRCVDAKQRRRQIYQQTHLVANLAPVHTEARSARARSASHPVARGDAPFQVVSVERHGQQETIGVAAHEPQSLGDITWLYPGQRYRHWQLETIEQAKRAAVFADGDQTVTVALPSQG